MNSARQYAGPVEAYTLTECATRLRISEELFNRAYTGPRTKIGSNVRIYAAHLHDWLDAQGQDEDAGDSWSGVGDAKEAALRKHQQGEAA